MSWASKHFQATDSDRLRLAILIAIHAVVAIVYGWNEWRCTLSIGCILTDFGSSYHASKLIESGLMPYVDFGYNYGGLGLIVVDSFHRVFGFSLLLHALIMYICVIVCFLLIYWFILKSKQDLIISSIILAASFHYFSAMWAPAFTLESLLLTGAVIFIYFKNHSLALLLSSQSFFVRPAISVYFIALIGCGLFYQVYAERSARRLAKAVAPALIASLLVIALIYARFGLSGVFGSLFPQSSLAAYKNYDYGFHNLLGLFYNGSDAISSIVTTICDKQILLALFFFLVARAGYLWMKRNRITMRIQQVAFAVSTIYILFLTTMYGNSLAWLNYAYLLTWCLPISEVKASEERMMNCLKTSRGSHGVLCLSVIIFSFAPSIRDSLVRASYASVVNLNGNSVFISSSYDDKVNALLCSLNDGNERVFFLGWGGCASEIYPNIQTSKSWAIVAGVCKENEIKYVEGQIAISNIVVELRSIITPTKIESIKQSLDGRTVVVTDECILYQK